MSMHQDPRQPGSSRKVIIHPGSAESFEIMYRCSKEEYGVEAAPKRTKKGPEGNAKKRDTPQAESGSSENPDNNKTLAKNATHCLTPLGSIWGSRVTRIFNARDKEHYFLKKPVQYHEDYKTEAACRFSTEASLKTNLALFPSLTLGGGVDFLRYCQKVRGNSSQHECGAGANNNDKNTFQYLIPIPNCYTESNHKLRFVCSKNIPGSMDLSKIVATAGGEGETGGTTAEELFRSVTSRQSTRLHMARALATLHSFGPHVQTASEASLPSPTTHSFPRCAAEEREATFLQLGAMRMDLPFLGSVRARLKRPIERIARRECPNLFPSPSPAAGVENVVAGHFAPTGAQEETAPKTETAARPLFREHDVDAVVERLTLIADSFADRIDALPQFPVTCDLQSKNMVLQPHSGATTIINTEILVKHSRLYDLIYLLIMDDFVNGVFLSASMTAQKDGGAVSSCEDGEEEEPVRLDGSTGPDAMIDTMLDSLWLNEFAQAIGVYASHLFSANGMDGDDDEEESINQNQLLFSEDEAYLFPYVVETKVSQIAVINVPEHAAAAQRCLQFLVHAPRLEEQLREVIRSVARDAWPQVPRSPSLLHYHWGRNNSGGRRNPATSAAPDELCEALDDAFGNCLLKLALQNLHSSHGRDGGRGEQQRKKNRRAKKALLYFNGTYAPFHQGHMEAMVQAASRIEAEDPEVEVVGIAVSPCRDTYAKKKLTKKAEMKAANLFNDVSRVALIDLALHTSANVPSPAVHTQRHHHDYHTHRFAQQLSFSNFNAFVDTNECRHHDAGDSLRYDRIVERWQKTVGAYNRLVGAEIAYQSKQGNSAAAIHVECEENALLSAEPVVFFCAGDDIVEYSAIYTAKNVTNKFKHWQGIVRTCTVTRKPDGAEGEDGAGIAKKHKAVLSQHLDPAGVGFHVTEPSTLSISSTKVREAWHAQDWEKVTELLGCGAAAWWLMMKTNGLF